MRGRVVGLLFTFALVCLMCLPFVVSSEADAVHEPEAPASCAQETACFCSSVPSAQVPIAPRRERAVTVEYSGIRTEIPKPLTDANGVPVIHTSYVRSNYLAFCLTGSGG